MTLIILKQNIIGAMSQIGIHNGLVVWMNDMLTSRIVISEMGNRTIKRVVKIDTPESVRKDG